MHDVRRVKHLFPDFIGFGIIFLDRQILNIFNFEPVSQRYFDPSNESGRRNVCVVQDEDRSSSVAKARPNGSRMKVHYQLASMFADVTYRSTFLCPALLAYYYLTFCNKIMANSVIRFHFRMICLLTIFLGPSILVSMLRRCRSAHCYREV